MNNYFCNKSYVNIYEQPKTNSKISTQIIYGEKFKVLKKLNNFLKIKTSYDKYVGYIKNNNFTQEVDFSQLDANRSANRCNSQPDL